jgi:hypothetical protein
MDGDTRYDGDEGQGSSAPASSATAARIACGAGPRVFCEGAFCYYSRDPSSLVTCAKEVS